MAFFYYRPGELPDRKKKTEPKIPESYVCLEIYSKKALEYIEGLTRIPSIPDATRKEIAEACKHKRSFNLPLARMPFEDLEMEAERQGCSWEDILWDKAHGQGEPTF